MTKDEITSGLQALSEEIAAARAALARGEEEIGLSNVGPRIEELCSAALTLSSPDVSELQPLMTQVRDDLQALSNDLGAVISRAEPDADGGKGGAMSPDDAAD